LDAYRVFVVKDLNNSTLLINSFFIEKIPNNLRIKHK
jgi:hypothetical protein